MAIISALKKFVDSDDEAVCAVKRHHDIDLILLDMSNDCEGGFSFLEVNDGSCMSSLQIIADGKLPNYQEEILKLQHQPLTR